MAASSEPSANQPAPVEQLACHQQGPGAVTIPAGHDLSRRHNGSNSGGQAQQSKATPISEALFHQ
jgi:hypothetical protein